MCLWNLVPVIDQPVRLCLQHQQGVHMHPLQAPAAELVTHYKPTSQQRAWAISISPAGGGSPRAAAAHCGLQPACGSFVLYVSVMWAICKSYGELPVDLVIMYL